MTTVNNANLFKEVENLFGQRTSYTGSSSASFDDIAWFSNAIKGSGENNNDKNDKTETKIKTLKNLAQKIINVINAKMAAEEETSESNEKIEKGNNTGKEVKETTEKQIEDILASVDSNVNSINEALAAIEKLGGDDSDGLEGLKEKLEEQKELIEAAIETLKNSNDEKEISSALETITTCQGIISDLVSRVDVITDEINKQTETVADLTTTIESQQSNAENLLADGLKAIEGIVVETSKEGTTNVSYIAKGGEEVAEGMEIQAAAAAATIGTLGTGAGVAAEAETKAIDLIEAGEVHISEGSKNLTSLGSALGKLGDSMKDVSAYSTTIGSALNLAQEVIGSYSNKANGFITATGSWSTIKSANEELDRAVKDYKGENKEKEVKKDTLFQFNVKEKFKLDEAIA